jgi:hypothetical protein
MTEKQEKAFGVKDGRCTICRTRIARLSPCEWCFLAAHPDFRVKTTPDENEARRRRFYERNSSLQDDAG